MAWQVEVNGLQSIALVDGIDVFVEGVVRNTDEDAKEAMVL